MALDCLASEIRVSAVAIPSLAIQLHHDLAQERLLRLVGQWRALAGANRMATRYWRLSKRRAGDLAGRYGRRDEHRAGAQ